MNPVIRRALLWRSGLALLVFGVIIGFAALSSPQPPWPPLFLPFFGAFFTYAVLMSTFGDRKLAVRAGRGDEPPWTGSGARCAEYLSGTPSGAATTYATRAITNVGGRNVELVNGSAAIGWVGSRWTNVPEWQEYELGIVVSPLRDGASCFTCCVRPRWKSTWTWGSKSQRLAESLRSEVEKLVGEP